MGGRGTQPGGRQSGGKRGGRRRDRIDRLIEEATIDCCDESEQAMGLFTMIEQHLDLPFETEILGHEVKVTKVELNASDDIATVCQAGRHRQRIPILDLPLPSPAPSGAEWIEAYRRWVGSR